MKNSIPAGWNRDSFGVYKKGKHEVWKAGRKWRNNRESAFSRLFNSARDAMIDCEQGGYLMRPELTTEEKKRKRKSE